MRKWVVLILVFCVPAVADPVQKEPARTEFERNLVGRYYVPNVSIYDGCVPDGWGSPPGQRDLKIDFFSCNGRFLAVLNKRESRERAVVLDALLLPLLSDKNDLKFVGECEDKKKPLMKYPDLFFFVIAHRDKRKESVNWRTGVKAAWWPNPDTLKFEGYPVRHIVCERPTPP